MDGITAELAILHQLSGSDYSRQVERIACRKEFHPLDTDENILSVGGEQSDDYQNLLIAARKAVEFGYKVFILPLSQDSCCASSHCSMVRREWHLLHRAGRFLPGLH